MRNILSVSVSKKMLSNIKRITKKGGYSSVSEFCRYVIRWYLDKKNKEKNSL